MHYYMKQFMLYLFRWQLSSPVLAACLMYLPGNNLGKTMVANLIGGVIFFWIDRYIFMKKTTANKEIGYV